MIQVRPRTPADDAALARLLEEMQAHYDRPCPPTDAVLRDLATLPAGVTILVAEIDVVIGFAAFSAIYPGPGLASGLFLKELFVSSRFRRAGAGSLLMRAVAEYAVRHGHRRVDWTAARNNPRLLEYYEGLGALKQEDKVFFRLTGEALEALAGVAKP
ncbi:MAG TPA: GNAT family N-acetyltransferase [Dongiaceae bacterium]|nr:GNAT family N-acetyltransferase [Dongiaceae bacterium]